MNINTPVTDQNPSVEAKAGELRLALSPLYQCLDRLSASTARLDNSIDRLGGHKHQENVDHKSAENAPSQPEISLLNEIEHLVNSFNTVTGDTIQIADRLESLI